MVMGNSIKLLKRRYEKKGINVTPHTPVFLSQLGHGKAISRQNASQIIRRAVKKIGLEG